MTDIRPAPVSRHTRLNLPLLAMIASVVIMSTGMIVVPLSSLNGLQFSFWRLWLGVAILGAFALGRTIARPDSRPSLATLRWSVWPGIMLGFSQPIFFTAMKLTSVTDVALLSSLVPLIVSLIAVPLLGERPGNRFRLWAVLAVIGTVLVAYGGSTGIEGNPAGIALACLSLIGWSFYMVLLKIGRGHLDAVILLWSAFLISALSVTVHMAATGWDVGQVSARDWALIAYLATIPGGMGMLIMAWSYRWLPANVPPLALRAEPVLSSAQAWWILSEPITPWHVVGGGIGIGGVVGALMSSSGQDLLADARTNADGTG